MTIEKISFTEMLIEENGLEADGLSCWIFCPGMLFNAPDKWWGDLGPRDFPHEGVDFCLYEDSRGRRHRFDADTRIPVVQDGVVRAVFKDYLGQAIVIKHPASAPGGAYLSVYAPTRPLDGIRPGAVLKKAQAIATVADTRRSKADILPHLHFSLGRPQPGLVFEGFIWNDMRDPDRIVLQNPLDYVDWPCSVLNLNGGRCFET